jgi:hypothetical protein
MAVGMTASSAQVTISGNVTTIGMSQPGTTQTLKHVWTTGTGAAATLATVTNGKTAYVVSMGILANAANDFLIMDSSDNIIAGCRSLLNSTATYSPVTPIWTYASGTNIRGSAANTSTIWIIYYEV